VNDDGERAERTLQPGTGTTDALLGAYYVRPGPVAAPGSRRCCGRRRWAKREDFRPGDRSSVDLGFATS